MSEGEPPLGDAVEEFLRSLEFEVSTTCIGNTIKVQGWPQQTVCEEGFQAGQPHLQNKFCKICRAGFAVSAAYIRRLPPDSQAKFINSTRSGFWSSSPELEGASYRVINQHHRCVGPTLILFNGPPPPGDWPALPPGIVRPTGEVWLRVAYSTLVPFVPSWSIDAPEHDSGATTTKQPVSWKQPVMLEAVAGDVWRHTGSKRSLADFSSVAPTAKSSSAAGGCSVIPSACSTPSSNRSSPPREGGAAECGACTWLTGYSPALEGSAATPSAETRSRSSSNSPVEALPRKGNERGMERGMDELRRRSTGKDEAVATFDELHSEMEAAFGYTQAILERVSVPPELRASDLPAEALAAKTSALELAVSNMRAALEANTITFQRAMLLTRPALVHDVPHEGRSSPTIGAASVCAAAVPALQPTSMPSASMLASSQPCSSFLATSAAVAGAAAPVHSLPPRPPRYPGRNAPSAPHPRLVPAAVPACVVQPPPIADDVRLMHIPSARLHTAAYATAAPSANPLSEGVWRVAQAWPCAQLYPPPSSLPPASSLPPSPPEPPNANAIAAAAESVLADGAGTVGTMSTMSTVTLAFSDSALEQAYRSEIVGQQAGKAGILSNGAIVAIYLAIIASQATQA